MKNTAVSPRPGTIFVDADVTEAGQALVAAPPGRGRTFSLLDLLTASSGSSSPTGMAPETPAQWNAWLRDHPTDAATDQGRYVGAQVAYLMKSGLLRNALTSWPGQAKSAPPWLDVSRLEVMESAAFHETHSPVAKAKASADQLTRDHLSSASHQVLAWLVGLLSAAWVSLRLHRTMGRRVESAMAFLSSRKASR